VAESTELDKPEEMEVDAKRQAHLARVQRIVEAGCERQAVGILALDVRAVTSIADSFIIMTGNSSRQIGAIGDAIKQASKEDNEEPLGIEGLTEGRWLLFDLNDIIVHVFLPDMRQLYDLERLWHDAPRIALDLPPEALAPPSENDASMQEMPVQEVYKV
jgi:ribosome-associated protein